MSKNIETQSKSLEIIKAISDVTDNMQFILNASRVLLNSPEKIKKSDSFWTEIHKFNSGLYVGLYDASTLMFHRMAVPKATPDEASVFAATMAFVLQKTGHPDVFVGVRDHLGAGRAIRYLTETTSEHLDFFIVGRSLAVN
jgi:hypothetical protein